MKKNLRKYAGGGIIGQAKAAIGGRAGVLEAQEQAALGLRAPPPPTALAPAPVTPNPNVLTEAAAKAARFKFERENPGKTYVPPKMANGGYLPMRSQSNFVDSTTPPPRGTPTPPVMGLQSGAYSNYANGGHIGPDSAGMTYHIRSSKGGGWKQIAPSPRLTRGMNSINHIAGMANGGPIGVDEFMAQQKPTTAIFPTLPHFVTAGNIHSAEEPEGYASGGLIRNFGRPLTSNPMMDAQAQGLRPQVQGPVEMPMPTMGGYGGGNVGMTDPARSVVHPSGLRTMNKSGTFDATEPPQIQWTPDTPDKKAAYMAAVAANQNAGSTIGGQDIATSVAAAKTQPMGDGGWNAMASNTKMGPGGYPMANGGYVGYADGGAIRGKHDLDVDMAGGAVQENGLRNTPMLMSGASGGGDPLGMAGIGAELAEGWRTGAIMGKSQQQTTKFLQSLRDGGKVRGKHDLDVDAFANGGALGTPKLSPSGGGVLRGKGGPTDDKQPILASPGEFVIPADTTAKIGADKLQAMVDATHEPVAQKAGLRFANAGEVPEVGRVRKVLNWGANKVGLGAKKTIEAGADAAAAAQDGFHGIEIQPPSVPNPDVAPTAKGFRNMVRNTAEGAPYSPLRPGAPAAAPAGPIPAGPSASAYGGAADAVSPGVLKPPNQPGSYVAAPKTAADAAAAGETVAGTVKGGLRTWGGPAIAAGIEAYGAHENAQRPGAIPAQEYARGATQFGAGMAGAATASRVTKPVADALQGAGPYGSVAATGLRVAAPVLGYVGGSLGMEKLWKYGGGTAGDNGGAPGSGPTTAADLPTFDGDVPTAPSKKFQEATKNVGPAPAPGGTGSVGPGAPNQPNAGTAVPVPAVAQPTQAPAQTDSGDSTYKDIMDAAAAQARTNTAKPQMTIEQANEAARGQMATMDAANLQKAKLQGLSNDRMRNETALTQADWDARQAAGEAKRFKYDPGSRRDAATKAGLRAEAQATNQAGIERQNAAMEGPLAREQQTKMANLAANTSLEGQRMGLRGQEYGANLGLASHMADRRLQMYRLRYEIGEKNMNDLDAMTEKRLQAFTPDEKGQMKLDPAATQARQEDFKRFAVNPSIDEIHILQRIQPGAQSIRDIPREKWGTVMDQFNGHQTLLKNIGSVDGETPQGMPALITAHENSLLDPFAMPGGPEKSKVGILSTAGSKINPYASPEDRITLTTHTPGSRSIRISAADATKGDRGAREALIHKMMTSGDDQTKQHAETLRKHWNL